MRSTSVAKPHQARFNAAFAAVLIALIITAEAPKIFDIVGQWVLKEQLSQDAELFLDALRHARSVALKGDKSIGISVDASGWVTFPEYGAVNDDVNPMKWLSSGHWQKGTKLGTSIPHGRFHFGTDGHCRIEGNRHCVSEAMDEGNVPAHMVAITSDARRVYTLSFDGLGMPILEYDDY